MVKEILAKDSARSWAYEMWKDVEMPMVTLFKTFDVTPLIKYSKKRKFKYNMTFCYALLKAATEIKEMYLFPVLNSEKWLQYDSLCLSIVANTKDGGINFCYVPYSDSIEQFNNDYIKNMSYVYETGNAFRIDDSMCVSTSALTKTEIDGIVNMYNSKFTNPFFAWGRYIKKGRKFYQPISLQFNHMQMDGQQVVEYFNKIQNLINDLK